MNKAKMFLIVSQIKRYGQKTRTAQSQLAGDAALMHW